LYNIRQTTTLTCNVHQQKRLYRHHQFIIVIIYLRKMSTW